VTRRDVPIRRPGTIAATDCAKPPRHGGPRRSGSTCSSDNSSPITIQVGQGTPRLCCQNGKAPETDRGDPVRRCPAAGAHRFLLPRQNKAGALCIADFLRDVAEATRNLIARAPGRWVHSSDAAREWFAHTSRSRVTAGTRAAETGGKHLGRPATTPRVIEEIEALARSTDLSIRQIQKMLGGRASRGIVGEVTKRARSAAPPALCSLSRSKPQGC
jgi:hypothetical protein